MSDLIGTLVHEVSTTTGTGNFTLAAANARTTFNDWFGTGGTDLFYYAILNRDVDEWEYGTGHLSDATTLVRDTVIGSSNANALVNFSAGSKDVINDLPAEFQVAVNDFPLLSGIHLGHASDTPLTRLSAGVLGVGGNAVLLNSQNLSDVSSASAARTNLGLAIGSQVQAYDAALLSMAGISWVQGDVPYWSGTDVAARLAKDANATRYLSNQGTSNDPSWNQVNLANGVTGDLPFANLTQIAGLSVLGVTGSATADVAAITASADGQVLRRASSTSVTFGTLLAGSFATGPGIVTPAMLDNGTALSVLGVTGNSAAARADIAAASDFQVLRRSGTAVSFGAIDLSQAAAVTGDLPFSALAQGSALSVLGVTGNATADNASIAAGTDHQVLRRSGTALAFGAVNLAQAAAVTGTLPAGNLPAATESAVGAVEHATDAEVRAATTGNFAVTAAKIESAAASVALTDAATVTVDWDAGVNFTLTLTTSRILGNPTNGQPGTWRSFQVTQPGGGAAVLSFGNQYVFPGAVTPIISATASAISRLMVYCRSSTVFEAYLIGAGY